MDLSITHKNYKSNLIISFYLPPTGNKNQGGLKNMLSLISNVATPTNKYPCSLFCMTNPLKRRNGILNTLLTILVRKV